MADSVFDLIAEDSADDILEVFSIPGVLDPSGVATPFTGYFDEGILEQVRGNEVLVYGYGVRLLAKISEVGVPEMGTEIQIDGRDWRVEVATEVMKPWVELILLPKV